ncbi:hypothetical protein DV736_g375, partial [Chaetothyriales sp. CBS 134916]
MTALQPHPVNLRHKDNSEHESLHAGTLSSVPGYESSDVVHQYSGVSTENGSTADRDCTELSEHREGADPATGSAGHPQQAPALRDPTSKQMPSQNAEHTISDARVTKSGLRDGDPAISQRSKNHDRRLLSNSALPAEPSPDLGYSSDLRPVRAPAPEQMIASPNETSAEIAAFVVLDGSIDPLNAFPRRRLSPVPSTADSRMETDGELKRSRNLTTDSVMSIHLRSGKAKRALSTPAAVRGMSSPRRSDKARPASLIISEVNRNEKAKQKSQSAKSRPLPSPMPSSIPLPPLSFPTYLQLELSSHRPSQPFIHRSDAADFPYESSGAKLERLLNFLLLPWHLESVLWFGMLACVDSWLYTFTILPLRLLKSFYILGHSWIRNLVMEIQYLSHFVYSGAGRMWERWRTRSQVERKGSKTKFASSKQQDGRPLKKARGLRHDGRGKPVPSMLLPDDKADMLKGLLIICTSMVLLQLDASRMYHWVRGQAAIKLYVIYNILEVCDRLFSAIGQDVLECLFSREALERKVDGRSKILRPLWLFILALVYTVIHSVALFYQVITLNVAVNSYSNALITLLMSNQFVEIKSTVFKKFEKENLFQLTCADVVERFQLWHMLLIIASRNIAETGGVSKGFSSLGVASSQSTAAQAPNSSLAITAAVPPLTVSSILPKSFTIVPGVVSSITTYVPTVNHVIGPFLIVMGSEMLVDWLKHAYINKFNNTRPTIYDRFMDVLAKDYYTNAFGDQNLTKRLGLPVIPLSCILIRASVQIYQMFMAAWMPPGRPSSSTTLAAIQEEFTSTRDAKATSTPVAIARKVDALLAGLPSTMMDSQLASTFVTLLVTVLMFLVLLACKLVLGMLLLAFARARYRSMKEREKVPISQVEGGRRVGGWGVVEVDEDKRRWIYKDDPDGLQALHDREKAREREVGADMEAFDRVKRYEMVAKRIW